LLQDKDQKTLNEQYHGVHGLTAALGSSKKTGLPEDAVEASRQKYGPNTYTAVPPKSFFSILYEGFKDPVILLLCAAATVSYAAVPAHGTVPGWHSGAC
jgi:magnesium-transporting ATPase (P-type)